VASGRQRVTRKRDEFARALAHGEFELYFQPAASIATGRIETFEALVRWRHPREGLLAPSMFLAALERSPHAWPFTRVVLERALSSARTWAEAGHACRVAVNVSAHLVNRSLADEVTDLLAALELPPGILELEVTESAVMDDPVAATRALDQLATGGIGGIAIDDFGTGHSSLGRLRDLPIDALKIDRSFVAELERGVDPAFVRSVIDLGHYLGLRVVAEGIEDEETWRALARLACDAGQGYWLSPPLPAGCVLDWIEQHDVAQLARLGAVGERRRGAGRRGLDQLLGAFERASDAMLVSDSRHRWVAVNAAARSLLRTSADALVGRHVDEMACVQSDVELTRLLGTLVDEPSASGRCDVTLGDGTMRMVSYELRGSFIPGHHVWVLARA
jgi:EAL domain-containing protein (putative c-di-GMP-specific phosphodiesterase class I)